MGVGVHEQHAMVNAPDSQEIRWPDNLKMGDTVELLGDTYEVIGTGGGEATLEHSGDRDVQIEVFRWAFTGQVGIELETDYSQDEFGEKVNVGDS